MVVFRPYSLLEFIYRLYSNIYPLFVLNLSFSLVFKIRLIFVENDLKTQNRPLLEAVGVCESSSQKCPF